MGPRRPPRTLRPPQTRVGVSFPPSLQTRPLNIPTGCCMGCCQQPGPPAPSEGHLGTRTWQARPAALKNETGSSKTRPWTVTSHMLKPDS